MGPIPQAHQAPSRFSARRRDDLVTIAMPTAESPADNRFVLAIDRIVWRAIDDEFVALDLQTSTYYSANSTGAVLLGALQQPSTVRDLALALVNHFDVRYEAAHADATEFAASLLENELIQLVPK